MSCMHCDKEVVSPKMGRKRKYCSRSCRQRAYEDRKTNMPELHSALSHVTHCYLCAKELDWNDRTNVVFDHAIPTVRGGLTNLDNLKPTHRTCNLKKSDKVVDVSLFGVLTDYYSVCGSINQVEVLGL